MENQNFRMRGILLGVIFAVSLPVWIKGNNVADQWSSWKACDKHCDGGIQHRARNTCPAEHKGCNLIEGRQCNTFSCDDIPSTSLPSSTMTTSPSSTMTTSLSTSEHAQKELLTSSSSPLTSPSAEVPEVTTELMTTPLIKPTPKTIRSTTTTTTTTTTTPAPKPVAGPKSGKDCLRSSFMMFSALLWHLS